LENFEQADAYFLTESDGVDTSDFTNYKNAKNAYDKKVKEIALLEIGCKFTEDLTADSGSAT
jgi:hypothetical protein